MMVALDCSLHRHCKALFYSMEILPIFSEASTPCSCLIAWAHYTRDRTMTSMRLTISSQKYLGLTTFLVRAVQVIVARLLHPLLTMMVVQSSAAFALLWVCVASVEGQRCSHVATHSMFIA